MENVRVYLTGCGQDVVDKAINVKCTKAEIIWVFTEVDFSKYNNRPKILYGYQHSIACTKTQDFTLSLSKYLLVQNS